MGRAIPILCGMLLFSPAYGQDVFVPRELQHSTASKLEKEGLAHSEKSSATKESNGPRQPAEQAAKKTSIAEPPANLHFDKLPSTKSDAVKFPVVRPLPANPHSEAEKPESLKRPGKALSLEANPHQEKVPAKIDADESVATKQQEPNSRSEKARQAKVETPAKPPAKDASAKRDFKEEQSVKAETAKSGELEKPSEAQLRKARSSDKAETATAAAKKEPAAKNEPAVNVHSEKNQPNKADSTKVAVKKESTPDVALGKTRPKNTEHTKAKSVSDKLTKPEMTKAATTKGLPASTEPEKAQVDSPKSVLRNEKLQTEKTEPANTVAPQEPTVDLQLSNPAVETGSTKLADGFDYPVGKPEAEGYYKARGFRQGGHVGEDWDGVRGGDTDLKDPIYCIGSGIVVFARDVHRGWGNVVIVRHAFRESGQIKHIDSLYGHLHAILVKRGQRVARGQQIGTMGTAHGQYDAHLHLEIRKNLEIGMSRAKFAKSFTNYYDPSQFIETHRHLSGGGANLKVAMNTFTYDSAFHFDDAPNYRMRKHSTAQSAAALKEALSNGSR